MALIGYKAFNENMTCTHGKGTFQYEVGQTYKTEGNAMIKQNGFHFCFDKLDCLHFYPNAKVICEVEPLGEIEGDGLEYATTEIKILRRVV